MTSPRITACLAALATIGLAAAGCTSGAADRSGGDVLLLRMATIDGYAVGSAGGSLAGPETFVEQLEALSDGRIQVEVTTSYGGGAAGAETRLVKAIASGDLDGGWPARRSARPAATDGK